MAPCKTPKSIKIRVPRHNAQRLGPSLTSTVRLVATREKKLVRLPPPVAELPSVTGASLENASEWNSLLLSARAQRGPFWDVSTQQFLVEKESELYYDPAPLLEATRSLTANNNTSQSSTSNSGPSGSQQQQQHQQHQQQHQRHQAPQTPQQQQQLAAQQARQAAFANQQQFGAFMGNSTPVMHATPTRGPPGMPGYGGTPGSAAGTPGQYFGDMGTPTRPGGMMNGAVSVGATGTPDMYGRRITRGMADGFPGFAG
ncbi:hypothetical protein ACEPAI_7017 [Sanghuangporus weigelae]